MDARKRIFTAIGAVALVAFVVLALISIMKPGSNNEPSVSGPSSEATVVPLPEQTFSPNPLATPTPSSESESVEPSLTPTPTVTEVPVVSPSVETLNLDGFGVNMDALEANLTPEEIQARETILKVIPVAANIASSKYTSPLGARDELVSQGLITGNMASSFFADQYTPFQTDINKSGFTVQTTGQKCIMRTLSPATALQLGKVNCYFTREYVDSDGDRVGNGEFTEKTGGIGAIDPTQIALVEVNIKQEGGSWKVDDLRFN